MIQQTLADSCIWIDFAQGKNTEEVLYFEELAREKLLYTCGLIKAEFIPFIQDKKIQKKVERLFTVVNYLEDPETLWEKVISYQNILVKKGHKSSIPDLILSTISIHYNIPLLTRDAYFKTFSNIIPLRLITF